KEEKQPETNQPGGKGKEEKQPGEKLEDKKGEQQPKDKDEKKKNGERLEMPVASATNKNAPTAAPGNNDPSKNKADPNNKSVQLNRSASNSIKSGSASRSASGTLSSPSSNNNQQQQRPNSNASPSNSNDKKVALTSAGDQLKAGSSLLLAGLMAFIAAF
ncbi:hypothetical protein BJ944DRAFT_274308, partial [Cunninghamella echinulata]